MLLLSPPILLLFDVGLQVSDRLLHYAGALDHLGQEHLALTKQVADHVHTVHQRALDHLIGPFKLLPGFLGIFHNPLVYALYQGMLQAFRHIGCSRQLRSSTRVIAAATATEAFRHIQQALGAVGAAVENDVLDRIAQFIGQVIVDRELARVDDAHIHARL